MDKLNNFILPRDKVLLAIAIINFPVQLELRTGLKSRRDKASSRVTLEETALFSTPKSTKR
jgi:hypothetical protein